MATGFGGRPQVSRVQRRGRRRVRAAGLRRWDECLLATRDVDEVYALAADMGGMGFISSNHATILRNNSLISTHTIEAARMRGVSRYLYSSSACIYPDHLQTDPNVAPLKEEDAYPADPQDAYGWEKLVSERLCQYYADEFGMQTRIVRFHNIYGPYGTYDGGREKAPAALCRKVAMAEPDGSIEVWGDGEQTRSFCYVDDCVEGIYRLMQSDYPEPLNLGTEEMVTINQLARLVTEVAGKQGVTLRHVDGRRVSAAATRQQPAAKGARLGATRHPRRGARAHIPVDRQAGQPNQEIGQPPGSLSTGAGSLDRRRRYYAISAQVSDPRGGRRGRRAGHHGLAQLPRARGLARRAVYFAFAVAMPLTFVGNSSSPATGPADGRGC